MQTIKLFLGCKTAPGVFSFDYSEEFISGQSPEDFFRGLHERDLSFVDNREGFLKTVKKAVEEAMESTYGASSVYKAGKCAETGVVCHICVNIEVEEEELNRAAL
ncbi:hypothetical protein [Limisalsivibrio acetivorans]|uniref:hypothetical protein n=1 Tax=Limisalsivibrio acetivorans TaxID=1304888 RepID=UPI0003B4022F|nr:hypothetical protein [Limisalsivibrio acetivorans]